MSKSADPEQTHTEETSREEEACVEAAEAMMVVLEAIREGVVVVATE